MILVSFFLILFPIKIGIDTPKQIVFWNVGQGQWITVLDTTNSCYHFDVGGEFINIKKVSQLCSKKRNLIFYSHWDWDHIGLTLKLKYIANSLCISAYPEGKASNFKKKYLASIAPCQNLFLTKIQKLNFKFTQAKIPNDFSHVFIYDSQLLVPGDSSKKMERLWSPLISHKKIKWLSLSHHGSKTSTSEAFLKNASYLTQAIASARKKVYGHPHKVVLNRLKKHGISVLKTEDWGNIHLLTR